MWLKAAAPELLADLSKLEKDVGYLVSHEAHHRGQVAVALKAAGKPVDRKVLYGMWEWGSR